MSAACHRNLPTLRHLRHASDTPTTTYHEGVRRLQTQPTISRSPPESSYTANQYSKAVGVSQRAACIHGDPSDTPTTTRGG